MRNEEQLFPPSLTLRWGLGASRGDRDPAGGSCGQLTDVGDGGDAAPLQGRVECGGAVRGDGDEQAAGGLGVGQEEAGLLVDALVVGDLFLQEIKVARRAPGDGALPGQSMCLWEEGNRADPDVGGDAAGGSQLMQVSQEPEAGD